jgi:hypothetical protein
MTAPGWTGSSLVDGDGLRFLILYSYASSTLSLYNGLYDFCNHDHDAHSLVALTWCFLFVVDGFAGWH